MPLSIGAVADEVRAGWRRGTMGPWREDKGAVCLVGAALRVLRQANGVVDLLDPYWSPEFIRFARMVGKVMREQHPDEFPPSGYASVPAAVDAMTGWNDRPGRTQEEVVAVLEKVAVLQVEQEAWHVAEG